MEKSGDRILQNHALRLVAPILEAVRGHPQVIRAEYCGSLRRRAETIGDLDVLCSSKQPSAVIDAFVKLPQVATVLAHGPTKASVRLADGVQCDLRASRTASSRSPSTTSRARRPTISRCGVGAWRGDCP